VGFGRRFLRRSGRRGAQEPGATTRRRRSFTVALIGVDGAGKTTVARELEQTLPLPARYVYMGANPEAASHLLPTTRLVRAVRRRRGTSSAGDFPRDAALQHRSGSPGILTTVHEGAWLANRIAEEWYRQLVVWRHLATGRIVLLDRHYHADYHATDVAGGSERSRARRLHGFLLARVYPKPDVVVFLDAPPEVLLARKGEGTVEYLSRRRDDYLALRDSTPHFVSVDATEPLDEVTADVADVIVGFARTGATSAARPSRVTG
jgi:thymidylate kinase